MSGRLGRTGWTAGIVCALSSSPALAWACPVCFAAKDEAQRVAFVVSTVFLTALPLCLVGGFIAWIARRVRALEADAAAEHPLPALPAESSAPTARVLPLGASSSPQS